jgi:hypothetical protein
LKLLSLREASRILHSDPRTIKYAIEFNNFPAQRLKKRYVVEKSALERWAAGHRISRPIDVPIPGLTDSPSPNDEQIAVEVRHG